MGGDVNRGRRVLGVLGLGLAVLALPANAYADPGDLDPSWDTDGILITEPDLRANTAVGQSDGALVVAGARGTSPSSSSDWLFLERFDGEANVDPDFGVQGKTNVSTCLPAIELAVLPDDSLLALSPDCLVRLTADGALDETFSQDGIASVDEADDLLADADGGALVASRVDDGGATVTRFLADGAVDADYGEQGEASIPGFLPQAGVALGRSGSSVVVGGVVASGEFDLNSATLVSLDESGSVDSIFGEDGQAARYFGSNMPVIADLLVQPDGAIVIAGSLLPYGTPARHGSYIARFTPHGSPDPAFGTDGTGVTISYTSWAESRTALAIEPNGALLASGDLYTPWELGTQPSQRSATLARFLPNGQYDSEFGFGGHAALGINGFDYGTDVVVSGDRAYLVGSAQGRHRRAGSQVPDRILVSRHFLSGLGADFDGDGFADEDDACPARFSESRHGCPAYERDMVIETKEISRDQLRLVGYVDSESEYCLFEDPLLQRRKNGRWVTVLESYPSHGSDFSRELDEPKTGRYRLTLKRNAQCDAARPVRFRIQ
jgi:uncharacterized delta-60 repeat protein